VKFKTDHHLNSIDAVFGRLSSNAKERTEMSVGEGVNRQRAVRVSRHRTCSESLRLSDNRMLCKGTALMRFAHIPTINTVLSNAAVLRLQSHHVVGFPTENRPLLTTRDGASELRNLNEWWEPPQGGQPRTPQARGPAVAEFKKVFPTELQRRGETGV
jgi:hypothetical protein